MSEPAQAGALGQCALSIAAALGDFELHIVTTFFLDQGHFNFGDDHRAVEPCRQNATDIQAEPAFEELGMGSIAAIATAVSADSTNAAASSGDSANTSRRPLRCTATWTWASGSTKRSQR